VYLEIEKCATVLDYICIGVQILFT